MRRHAFDPFSLVIGATLTLLGVTFLLTRADIEPLRWVWPVPIIVLGALIVAVSVRRGHDLQETGAESDDRRQ
jgi:hypothetical protein